MFVLLEFLGKLFWVKFDREVVHKKKISFLDRIELKNIPQCLIDIFQHLKPLQYEDKPDYEFVKSKLLELSNIEDPVEDDIGAQPQGNRSPTDSNRLPMENQVASEVSRKRSRSREGSEDLSAKRSKH
jgi:hypothetical protein